MKAVLVCSLFVLSLPLLFAQKACIQGRVVDTNGSPIASMYVTITNREIGVSLPSAHDGTFSIDPLPPGKYDLATSEDRPDLAARQSGTEKDPALVQAVATEGKCASVILRR